MQSAALRALGVRRSSDHRQVMIDQLGVTDPMVRAAAANGLGTLREGYAIKPLAEPSTGHSERASPLNSTNWTSVIGRDRFARDLDST